MKYKINADDKSTKNNLNLIRTVVNIIKNANKYSNNSDTSGNKI